MSAIGTRDDAEFNPHFQVGLDLAGRRCLVIGGGAEASDKAGRLLEAQAEVLVVAPVVNAPLQDWAAGGRIHHQRRRYRNSDLHGVHLVLNTVRSDAALCQQVFAQAQRERIPINTFDLPRYSTMAMAALVTCGHLRISISTSNAAPALAGRLRRELEAILRAGAQPEAMPGPGTAPEEAGTPVIGRDPGADVSELEQFLDALGEVRALAKQRVPAPAERRTLLRGLVDGFHLTGTVHLPPGWRQRLAEVRAGLEQGHTPQPSPRHE